MAVLLHCGFQEINLTGFRSKSISKGRKLVNSNHVSCVREEIYEDWSRIFAKVIPETSVNKSEYLVEVDLNFDRTVHQTRCTCKAGLGRCKHAAAVCTFVNDESPRSKTGEPLNFNRPSEIQLQKYKKGARMEKMFPPKSSHGLDLFKSNTIEDVRISEEHLSLNSSFSQMVAAEITCEAERNVREQKRRQEEELLMAVLEQLFQLQSCDTTEYGAYESSGDGTKITLRRVSCPPEYAQQFSNVIVNRNSWTEICFRSTSQSSTAIWFEQRSTRITCSKKAHDVKTRQKDFESLARRFRKETPLANLPPAMQYGIDMEPIARDFFQAWTGLKVHEVGLVVSNKQPFLACSPDGVIFSGEEPALLEIKCPATREWEKIVDLTTKQSFVPYLTVDDQGEVHLSTTHKYYTQVQVSMYILNMHLCYFFLYSKMDHVLLEIRRDEQFLREVIPKIEFFYYKYFLPLF